MSVASDLDKKLTLGDPDGPDEFIPELGLTVPTFIDPREDLIPKSARGKFKRLSHHVPFNMRGTYRPDQLPDDVYNSRRGRIKVTMEGLVICSGNTLQGFPCSNPAANRSLWCRNHGGALHPSDKKMSGQTVVAIPKDRIENLDRVQRFMQGFIDPSELDDDEIQGQFVRNSDGIPVSTAKLGTKFQAQISQELHLRLNRFLQSKTSKMLNVMVDIAESDIVEPQDRIKAAIWVAERTMGKTPDIIIHGQTGKPYETIFENLESGSREAYRINSSRPLEAGAEIFDAETVEAGTDEDFTEVEEISERDDSETETMGEISDDSGSGVRSFDRSRQNVAESSGEPRSGTDSNDSGILAEDEHNEFSTSSRSNDYNQKPPDKVIKYITLEQQRAEIKAKKDRIKKAKSRRYAARAAGVPTVADTPWLIDWRSRQGGAWCARIVVAEAQTPTLLAKLESKKTEI